MKLTFGIFLMTAAIVVVSIRSALAFASSSSTSARTNKSLAFLGRRQQQGTNKKNSMGSSLSSSTARSMSISKAEEFAKKEISSSKVVIFSKSYCPYCTSTKDLFLKQLKVDAKVYELDNMKDGSDIQNALLQMTGQRTVPNVFINGQHIGGNDKCQAANSNGTLKSLLQKAGVTL